MSNQRQGSELTIVQDTQRELLAFEKSLISVFGMLGLPQENILVKVQERGKVFKNIEEVVGLLTPETKAHSVYVSKFLAAAAAGLFDASLNYLWDETVLELRKRVVMYDINYFYDQAINSEDRRKKFKDESDLIKLDDSELIEGARQIDLISGVGFKHLDYIKYMRNWASAAHPNQNELTGLQLISWLETCIKEVISLPLSSVAIEIKKLLVNIKKTEITKEYAESIVPFFIDLPQDRAGTLLSGLFGLYYKEDTSPQIIDNINLLAPKLWAVAPDETKENIGIKYAKFKKNSDIVEEQSSRKFLELVGGLSFIPDELKIVEIDTAMKNLLQAHRAPLNNFYHEPAFARALDDLIGTTGFKPEKLHKTYVIGLVEVFLTNGNGVAWNAEPIYIELIKKFDSTQTLHAILSFNDQRIASKLQFPLCKSKFLEMLDMLEKKVTSKPLLDLINEIRKNENGDFSLLNKLSNIKQKMDELSKLYK